MTNPPERVFILTSDAVDLGTLEAGRAETVVAGSASIHNMHGEAATTEYIRADLFTTLQEQYDKAVALSDGQAELNDALQAEVDRLAKQCGEWAAQAVAAEKEVEALKAALYETRPESEAERNWPPL